MKKTILPLTVLSLLLCVQAARATISIGATPSTQTVAPGGSFSVSLTLSVTQGSAPANVAGFDLYFVTAAANSGRFRITTTNATGPFNAAGPTIPTGGDALSTTAASGYVRNGTDLGYSGTAQATPFSNLSLESVTFSLASTVPAGTYTFQTSTTPTAGVYYSDVAESPSGNVYEITSPGSFSVTVVPEPSSWMLLTLAAVVGVLSALRRKGIVSL